MKDTIIILNIDLEYVNRLVARSDEAEWYLAIRFTSSIWKDIKSNTFALDSYDGAEVEDIEMPDEEDFEEIFFRGNAMKAFSHHNEQRLVFFNEEAITILSYADIDPHISVEDCGSGNYIVSVKGTDKRYAVTFN